MESEPNLILFVSLLTNVILLIIVFLFKKEHIKIWWKTGHSEWMIIGEGKEFHVTNTAKDNSSFLRLLFSCVKNPKVQSIHIKKKVC